MSFSASPVEEVKSRLDIVQVLSEYLTVKKAGSRFVALCPFHHEKTPSFSISPDNQFWYCFGCGEGGDVFKFVQRVEGLEFPDALRLLAKKAGVQLKDEDPKMSSERQRLTDLNRLAARFWNEVLVNQPAGERGRAYTEKRALKPETIESWLIGYAPDSWDATLNFLKSRGYTEEELLKAGLILKSERTGNYFDRFRGRLMFPIRDTNGSVVGFTGRIMPGADGKDDKKEAKYMNTPQTLVYDKSRVVFGLDKAKQSIRREGKAVIVEGNMDVISSHQAGVENVVASSGTALTDQHLKQISRFTNRIAFVFDNDAAGNKAFEKKIFSLDELELKGSDSNEVNPLSEIKKYVVEIPQGLGKDPDEIIKNDVNAWRKAVNEEKPYIQWYLLRLKETTNLNDDSERWKAALKMLERVASISNEGERMIWLGQIDDVFGGGAYSSEFFVASLYRELGNLINRRKGIIQKNSNTSSKVEEKSTNRPKTRMERISESVLAILCAWPDLMPTAVAHLEADDLDAEFVPLYTSLIFSYNKQRSGEQTLPGPDSASAMPNISNISQERLTVLRLLAERDYGELTGAERRDTLVRLSGEIKEHRRSRAIRELTEQMADAEKNGDKDAISKIHAQLKELLSKGTAARPKL